MTADTAATAAHDERRADLPQLPLLSQEFQDDPHRLLREAREQGPVAYGPLGLVALSYDAVQTVLRDRRFRRPDAMGLALVGITSGPLWDKAAQSIVSLDGAEHQRLRKLVVRAFTPACAARLRSVMTEVITELTDRVTPMGYCDIVAHVARPYPIPIICELLGAPRQDWPLFSAWADEIFKIFTLSAASDEPEILRAIGDLEGYIDRLVSRRRYAISDDLISSLITAEGDGEKLTHDELIMMAGAVLAAGTDTTRNQLAAAVDVFCDHPGQWALLAAQPHLAPQAVDEVMRHSPVALLVPRIAVEDVELAGVAIPAGTHILASTAAANRDPSVYPDPDWFDITREDPEPMLTFGGGLHYCLGVHLAKAEIAVALTVLARRMPDLGRAGPAPWKPVIGVTGPVTLPVQFEPGH
jgi:cytochrome P450